MNLLTKTFVITGIVAAFGAGHQLADEKRQGDFAIQVAKYALEISVYKGKIPESITFDSIRKKDLIFVKSHWTTDPTEKQYVIIVHAPSMCCLGVFADGLDKPENITNIDAASKKFMKARNDFTDEVYRQLIKK